MQLSHSSGNRPVLRCWVSHCLCSAPTSFSLSWKQGESISSNDIMHDKRSPVAWWDPSVCSGCEHVVETTHHWHWCSYCCRPCIKQQCICSELYASNSIAVLGTHLKLQDLLLPICWGRRLQGQWLLQTYDILYEARHWTQGTWAALQGWEWWRAITAVVQSLHTPEQLCGITSCSGKAAAPQTCQAPDSARSWSCKNTVINYLARLVVSTGQDVILQVELFALCPCGHLYPCGAPALPRLTSEWQALKITSSWTLQQDRRHEVAPWEAGGHAHAWAAVWRSQLHWVTLNEAALRSRAALSGLPAYTNLF